MAPSDTLVMHVVGLLRFATFAKLFATLDLTRFGWPDASATALAQSMYDIYSPDQERALGVLAIVLEPLTEGEAHGV